MKMKKYGSFDEYFVDQSPKNRIKSQNMVDNSPMPSGIVVIRPTTLA